GVAPRTKHTEDAGLEIDNGVLTTERLQTSANRIYAAGDLANAVHPLFGQRIRVEHWANALNQGPAAARNMLGRDAPYDNVPYFFSDQYDVGMEYAGYATDGREFVAFWLRDGRVLAGMNVNVWDVTDDIQELIRSKARIERDRLTNTDVPLDELAASVTRADG